MLFEYKDLLEDVDGHPEYEKYLTQHINNVRKGYEWL